MAVREISHPQTQSVVCALNGVADREEMKEDNSGIIFQSDLSLLVD